jgi:hypothetical protein
MPWLILPRCFVYAVNARQITDPGGLHPKEWTLRDTAVKRFRRSAADFKLDIPEWVRPPEILERV